MQPVPETVKGDVDRDIYRSAQIVRATLKQIIEDLGGTRQHVIDNKAGNSETIANVTLAYRHLEDASMRLGKVLQSLDGGVSVYDKATVPEVREVGTPRQGRGLGG